MKSKRITLVRPSYSLIYGVYGKLPKDREIRPPLGLLYVAASLERAGHKVAIIDAEPSVLSVEQTCKAIAETEPEVVGFTSTTPEFHFVEDMVRTIKKMDSSIVTIVGGAHVSAIPHETLRDCPEIDYVVCGEGERSAVYIVNEQPSDRVVRLPNQENLDDLPVPARHLLDYSPYKYAEPGRGIMPMDVVESSRGCPCLCTFCFNRSRKPRYRSPKLVVDEIQNSYETYGTRFFMFLDDTLTINKQHVMGICDEIIRRGLNKVIVFYANTRADATDREMLLRMRGAGLTEISAGVETGNAAILKAVKKGTTLEQYRTLYRWLYDMGLQTRASFIVGLPYETHKTIRDTINFAKELPLMRANCNILTPYPGTMVYKQALEGDGLHLLCKDWKEFKRWGTSVVRTNELSKGDLEYYQRRFLTEFYSQPKVVWYHCRQLLKGNFSYYYYRPVIFALRNRLLEFLRPRK